MAVVVGRSTRSLDMARIERLSTHLCLILVPSLLSGCAVLGYGERADMRKLQADLRCGMSLGQVQALTPIHVRALDDARTQMTHVVLHGGANVGMRIEDRGLVWSELNIVDGFKSDHTEPRINHCELARNGHV